MMEMQVQTKIPEGLILDDKRILSLSYDQLDHWIQTSPASYLLFFAKARKYVLDSQPVPEALLNNLAALAPDRKELKMLLYRPVSITPSVKDKKTKTTNAVATPQKKTSSTKTPSGNTQKDTPARRKALKTSSLKEKKDTPKKVQKVKPAGANTKKSKSKSNKKTLKPKKEVRQTAREPESFTAWLRSLKPSKKSPAAHQNTTKKSPKISKRLKRAVKKAKAKTTQPVSETYADLLASQGHIKKAKEIYKKLMVMYPEKKSIFAQKLENLKK